MLAAAGLVRWLAACLLSLDAATARGAPGLRARTMAAAAAECCSCSSGSRSRNAIAGPTLSRLPVCELRRIWHSRDRRRPSNPRERRMTATRAMVDPSTFSRKVTRGLPMPVRYVVTTIGGCGGISRWAPSHERDAVNVRAASHDASRVNAGGEPDRLGQAIALRWLPVRGYCLRATQAGNVSRVKRRSTRSLDM